jgi:hypothetical protein
MEGDVAYSPPDAVRPKLGTIVDLLPAAVPIVQDFVVQPACLATLPGGELYMDNTFELDTDGWPGAGGLVDPDHQSETSLLYSTEESINANEVPYFVLPLPEEWPAQFHMSLGDYGVVLSGSRLSCAIFADEGPADKIGEGSLELFRRLGHERLRQDGSVWDTGIDDQVVLIVFPGSGRGQRHFADQQALAADIEAVGRQHFVALGGAPDA